MVCSAVAEARSRYGPVRGVIHGAGVLADRRIEDKTREQFDAVFGTKVIGLRALLASTTDDPLRFLALFSSSTARFGRTGQCDYAAANEVLNVFARQFRHTKPDCRVVSFNWGPWDGGMVTPGLRSLFESEGVGVIPLADGARFFVSELCATDGPADVVVLGPPPTMDLTLTDAHPVLRDHIIAGRPVVPMALAFEWMVAAASRCAPGQIFVRCDNLRVLRPITVDSTPTRLQIKAVPHSADEHSAIDITIELIGDGPPVPAYRGEFVFANDFDLPDARVPTGGETRSISINRAYGDLLFHGPALHGFSSIRLVGVNAVEAQCHLAFSPGMGRGQRAAALVR